MRTYSRPKALAERRSVSQVVYNFLPGQIVDLRGRVWKVTTWRDPIHLRVDEATIRRELQRALTRWDPPTDGDLRRQLAGIEIDIVTPSEQGVEVVPFPKLFRCRTCGQIENDDKGSCVGGNHHTWASFQFVAFHTCGKIGEPFVPRCKTHHKVRSNQPKSRNARDVRFSCPVCNVHISDGIPYTNCSCGDGKYSVNPPRASTVYSGHSMVVINPPTMQVATDFAGEAARTTTLDWVLDGMPEANALSRTRNIQSLVDQFVRMGIDEIQAKKMAVAAARASGGKIEETGADIALPSVVREHAIDGALKLAFASVNGRITVDDLKRHRGDKSLTDRYEVDYPKAMYSALLENVIFLERFPILTAFYGYSRGDGTKAAATARPILNWFRERGRLRLYSLKAETEALVFSLDPVAIIDWLTRRGHAVDAHRSARDARKFILENADFPAPGEPAGPPSIGNDILTLVHSYAHRVLRAITAFCGIDREALAEYLIPEHCALIVYANTRGDFVLGGLQALFENDLNRALDRIINGERRCALDPGCREAGSACMACMHVGEPSCRYYNRSLTRDILFGETGFLSH